MTVKLSFSATFLESLTKVHMASQSDKALLCQKAEHLYAEMPCGIMDQMISVMGQKNHVLLIDCLGHTATLIPFKSDHLSILIANSNVKHELSSSQYAVRREECSQALSTLGYKSYRQLADLSVDNGTTDVDYIISGVKDEVQRRRAKHVITEIRRTRAAAEALQRNDFVQLGRLMNESHESLDKDFEVSCPETNVLVELTRKCKGVYGARQTGGGFGGCIVSLIEKDNVEEAIAFVAPKYLKETGYEATFFIAEPGDGARVVKYSG